MYPECVSHMRRVNKWPDFDVIMRVRVGSSKTFQRVASGDNPYFHGRVGSELRDTA